MTHIGSLQVVVNHDQNFLVLRRAQERMNREGSGGRVVRAWTMRKLGTAHFSRADEVQVDISGSNRDNLAVDA